MHPAAQLIEAARAVLDEAESRLEQVRRHGTPPPGPLAVAEEVAAACRRALDELPPPTVSLSLPIVFVCASILLLVATSLLQLVLSWLPMLGIELPGFPKPVVCCCAPAGEGLADLSGRTSAVSGELDGLEADVQALRRRIDDALVSVDAAVAEVKDAASDAASRIRAAADDLLGGGGLFG